MKWIADDPVKNAKTVAEIVVGPYGAYEDAGRARKSFSKGNYGEAAFDATMMGLGALPLGGAMVKGIKAARGPVYRSRLASALEDMPMDKMSGQQAASHFKKYPGGVGADELEYTGVAGLLNQPKLTRQQLLDQYNTNPLEINDVVRADEIAGYGVTQNIDDLRRRYEMMTGPKPANQHLLPPSQRRNIAWTPEKVQAELARINAMERANITGPTKFGPGSEYNATLPGGKDYQEMLLTLPDQGRIKYTKENVIPIKSKIDWPGATDTERFWYFKTPDNVLQIPKSKAPTERSAMRYVLSEKQPELPAGKNYTQGHYSEHPNVLAHGRYNTRNIDGDKTLFVEEIQSDWHQKAREIRTTEVKRIAKDRGITKEEASKLVPSNYGYKQAVPPTTPEIDAKLERYHDLEAIGNQMASNTPKELTDEWRVLKEELQPWLQSQISRVPDAPYKSTDKWQDLTFRRMVKQAVDSGHDRIAWTPGKVQAERYDLSKHMDTVRVEKLRGGGKAGQYYVTGTKDGRGVGLEKVVPENELSELIGKDLAEKAIKDAPQYPDGRDYSGLDLQVGGEGMKEFYDKILKKTANKFGKKYDQKVEMKNLNTGSATSDDILTAQNDSNTYFQFKDWIENKGLDFEDEAVAYSDDLWGEFLSGGKPAQVWSLKITDKMKKDILKGGVALSGTGVAASSLLAGQEDYY
jgi:hypothetical protein